MADKKISELVELTSLAVDDVLPVVDAGANATKRITAANLSSEIRGDIVSGDLPPGSIVQVVYAQNTSQVTISISGNYIDVGNSATITPTSITNKVLVIANLAYEIRGDYQFNGFDLALLRGNSIVWDTNYNNTGGTGWVNQNYSTGVLNLDYGYITTSFLDSPATTSSVTYKQQAQMRTTAGSGQLDFQRTLRPSSITLLEVVA